MPSAIYILESAALTKVQQFLRDERRADILAEQALGPTRTPRCAVIVIDDAADLERLSIFDGLKGRVHKTARSA